MEFVETLLPGVGMRYDATTRGGSPITLVIGRTGDAELVAYRREDPDAAAYQLHLDPDESVALASLLGAPRMSTRLADLSREVPGLSSAHFEIRPGSRYDGRRLGDSKARTRTGCSIVAIVRGEQVYAAPGPRVQLRAGDILVAIGSEAGLADLGVIVAMSPRDAPFPVPPPDED